MPGEENALPAFSKKAQGLKRAIGPETDLFVLCSAIALATVVQLYCGIAAQTSLTDWSYTPENSSKSKAML